MSHFQCDQIWRFVNTWATILAQNCANLDPIFALGVNWGTQVTGVYQSASDVFGAFGAIFYEIGRQFLVTLLSTAIDVSDVVQNAL